VRRIVLGFLVPFAAGASACSSSSAPVAGAHDAAVDAHARGSDGATDATLGPPKGSWEASLADGPIHVGDAFPDVAVVVDDANCVPPGTASNASGVGGYCSPGGGQCNHAGEGGGTTLCTADFNAPLHAWFCTLPCTTTSDCGQGTATCIPAAGGLACVPAACGAFAGDASVDGMTDAASPRDAGDGGLDGGDAAAGRDAGLDADAGG
jgi:hypothetical protein